VDSLYYSVSCATSTWCLAIGVGASGAGTGSEPPIAAIWSAGAWTTSTPVLPTGIYTVILNSVSCTSSSSCLAVGYGYAGGAVTPLAELWNGTIWKSEPPLAAPSTSSDQLDSVSCASAKSCLAVGSAFHSKSSATGTLAELWNGTAWHVLPTPNPAASIDATLDSVACPSPAQCTAVGYWYQPSGTQLALAETWSGTSWVLSQPPVDGAEPQTQLDGVSCTAVGTCLAVGYSQTASSTQLVVAAQQSGSSWTAASPTVTGTNFSTLAAVSCSSAGNCVTVGSDSDPGGDGQSPGLAMTWTPSSANPWTEYPLPTMYGLASSYLSSISCVSATACWAVGHVNDYGGTQVQIQHWNGSSWIRQSVSFTQPSPRSLYAVSCVSAVACTALGSYTQPSGSTVSFLITWNGSKWSVNPVVPPNAGPYVGLGAISCGSPTSCLIVGDTTNTSGSQTLPLAERVDSSGWKILTVPSVPGPNSGLADVSCTSTSACTAVGSDGVNDVDGQSSTLAMRWNGTSWKVQTTTNPYITNIMTGVSCPSMTFCAATGSYFDSPTLADHFVRLAETWSGTSWVTTKPPQEDVNGQFATNVSCASPTACAAVSGYYERNNTLEIIVWNGASWALVTAPGSAATMYNSLSRVSCASSICVAIGGARTPGGATVPIALTGPS
jgi:hypothetical protein